MKSEVYKIKVDTRDELLARISDAAARINESEDQLKRRTRHLHTRNKRNEVYDEIFKPSLSTVKQIVISV